jgi:hypothetical protein
LVDVVESALGKIAVWLLTKYDAKMLDQFAVRLPKEQISVHSKCGGKGSTYAEK